MARLLQESTGELVQPMKQKGYKNPSCEFYLGQFINILMLPNCRGSMV